MIMKLSGYGSLVESGRNYVNYFFATLIKAIYSYEMDK